MTWFLTVSNIGLNDAEGVFITDTLPAGLSYVSGSTSVISPAGWSFGGSSDPVIAGSTLTWSNLRYGTSPHGYFAQSPGVSAGPVTIAFRTTVSALTVPGTTLNNNVAVSTGYDRRLGGRLFRASARKCGPREGVLTRFGVIKRALLAFFGAV